MYTFCIVLILIASVLLILAVLSQHPKSGMAANFGATGQVMGVRQASDFLEKFTWGTAIAIVVLSLVATMSIPKGDISKSKSELEKSLTVPAAGTPSFSIPAAGGEEGTEGELPAQGGEAPAGEAPAGEAPAQQ